MHKTGELEIKDFKNIDKKSKKESIIVFTGVVLVTFAGSHLAGLLPKSPTKIKMLL